MRRMIRRIALTSVAGVGMLLSVACSGGEQRLPESGATVEGTITYGGEKVPYAQVILASPTAMAYGNVGEDGRYKVENAPLGEVKVGVSTEAAKGDMMSKQMASSYTGPDKSGKPTGGPPPKFVSVPAKYADPETSGLKTTVNKGSNTFDIAVPK